jgi:hypothetical protein
MFNKLTLLLTFGILLSAVWANIVAYAQNNNTTNTAVPPKTHTVKITSPTKGQQVPIGDNLIVSGTSLDNATPGCQVSVIVNSIKPYQPALASGHGGANDYSKWNFTLSPKYTAIKEGENKITAKYSCSSDSSLVSFSSINVTGIATGAAGATKQQKSVITGNNAAKENSSTVLAATPSTQSESSYIGSGKAPGHRSTSSSTSTCSSSESGSSSNGSSCTSGKAPGHRSTSSSTSTCSSSESGSSSNGSSCTSGKAPGHRSSRELTTQGSSQSQFNPFIFPFGPP